ncbi:uncharacterized protein LOC132204277 [Neocloeon triangulifer]|uniref:uncharacterized protein LOC132204277 n=1 Tax=Neocloeon triangulifer TaxID=2078957 RepID=UPI00286EDE9A|nr:uncharacterized protein LOC132204277 [Neocloeon triangulifer]
MEDEEGQVMRQVNLVFDDELVLREEVEFLREISDFFDGMFRGDFEEATAENIDLRNFCGQSVRLILRALKNGKNINENLSLTIYNIMKPTIFKTLRMLMIKADLEQIAMLKMLPQEIAKYRQVAADTGNEVLENCCLRKAVGIFKDFRKTRNFKKLPLEKLKTIINHMYLDCESETQILTAIFGWLNFDMRNRQRHFEEALSLINWPKVKRNQFKFLMKRSNIVKRSKKLKKLISAIYYKLKIQPTLANPDAAPYGLSFPREIMKSATDILASGGQRSKRPLFFMVQTEFIYSKERYAALFFYDAENGEFTDNLVCEPKESMSVEHDFDIYDFQIYMFGRVSSEEAKGLIKSRPMCFSNKWKKVGRFEARKASISTNTGDDNLRHDLRQLKLRERNWEVSSERQNGFPIPDNPIDVQRSGRDFFIFHVGCDKFDTKYNHVTNIWKRDDGYTCCVAFPFIFRAFRDGKDLKLSELNLTNNKRTKVESDFVREVAPPARARTRREEYEELDRLMNLGVGIPRRVQEPPPPMRPPVDNRPELLPTSGFSFLTPIEKRFYFSEKMFGSFNYVTRIAGNKFHVQVPYYEGNHPIAYQFSYENTLHFLLNEKPINETGERKFGLYKSTARRPNVMKKIRSYPDMAAQMKNLLVKHLPFTQGEINLSNSMKFKTVNPVWVEGFKYTINNQLNEHVMEIE